MHWRWPNHSHRQPSTPTAACEIWIGLLEVGPAVPASSVLAGTAGPTRNQLVPNFTDIPRLARSAARMAEITRTLAKYGLADVLARLDSRSVHRWAANTDIGRL